MAANGGSGKEFPVPADCTMTLSTNLVKENNPKIIPENLALDT